MNLTIPLLPVQREFLQATDRFVAIVASRSCGKSWVAILGALLDLLSGRNVLYLAQTDGAFYRGPWLHLQNFLREFNLMGRWSWNGQLKVGKLALGNGKFATFYYGSYVAFDATSSNSSGRGASEISTVYLDEFQLSKPSILAIVAPCQRGNDCYGNKIVPRIRATGTPDMASMWQMMLVEPAKYGIRLLRTKMSENVFMTDEQRDSMSSVIYDDKLRRQEIEGEILIGDGATNIISITDFPRIIPMFSDKRIYAGLDMAHTGLRDGHSFAAIRGNELLAFHEFGFATDEDVAHWILKFQNAVGKIDNLNVDLAWSEGITLLLKYSMPVNQISFAARPHDESACMQYANERAYGYFRLAEMHRGGLCVDVPPSPWIDDGIVAEYKREICNTHFTMDRLGRLLIEPKDDIKLRIGRSPDPADSLMLASLARELREDPVMASTSASVSMAEMAAMMEDE